MGNCGSGGSATRQPPTIVGPEKIACGRSRISVRQQIRPFACQRQLAFREADDKVMPLAHSQGAQEHLPIQSTLARADPQVSDQQPLAVVVAMDQQGEQIGVENTPRPVRTQPHAAGERPRRQMHATGRRAGRQPRIAVEERRPAVAATPQ